MKEDVDEEKTEGKGGNKLRKGVKERREMKRRQRQEIKTAIMGKNKAKCKGGSRARHKNVKVKD